MADEERIDPIPVFLRRPCHQIEFDLPGCGMFRESQSLCNTEDMRIHGDALGFIEHDMQNNGCSFSADTRQRDQFLHGIRHLPFVMFN